MKKNSNKKSVKKKATDEVTPQALVEEGFADTFNQEFDEKEKDNILGMYGNAEHTLGVVKTVYSGLPSLDKILSVKRDTNIYGVPMNKIIEIFGQEGSGKCLTGDTYIYVENEGMVTVKEIFNQRKKERPYRFINKRGKPEKVTHFHKNGKKKIIKLTTHSGNVIKSTLDHPHLAVVRERVWKKAKDFKIGDFLVLATYGGYFGNTSLSYKACCNRASSLSNGECENFYQKTRGLNEISLTYIIKRFINDTCHIDKKKKVLNIRSASHTLLFQLKLILQNQYGIISFIEDLNLAIYENDLSFYVKKIGFNSLSLIKEYKEIKPNRSRKREPFFHDPIISIEECEEEYVYDFTLPESHSFIANGIVTHNSSLALFYCSAVIKQGGLAYYVDFEHKYDPAWNKKIALANGVTQEQLDKRFRYVKPQHFEWFIIWLIRFMKMIISSKTEARKAIREIEKKSKKPDGWEKIIERQKEILNMPSIVVIDSVAAINTIMDQKAEDKAEKTGQQIFQVAEIARKLDECLNIIRRYLGKTNTVIIGLNQIRDRIEMNSFLAKFGSKIKTKGGNAWKHYCDARIQLSRKQGIKRTRNKVERLYGSTHILKTVKNQMGIPPFREVELRFLYDRGFFTFHSILEQCVESKIIAKKGSVYRIKMKSQVIEIHEGELDEYLLDNPKIEELLHSIYRKKMENG